MVLSFRKFTEYIEISRICSKSFVLIMGGVSKLLSEVKRLCPGFSIRTQVDLRYADGHSLRALGFNETKVSLQYQYINNKKQRIDKRKMRVKAGVNEKEEAFKRGWYRIWDAGKASYELKDGA